MRIVLISLLALSVSAVSSAETVCGKAYEKLHAQYFTQLEELQNEEFALRASGVVLGTGAAYCMWKTRAYGLRASVVMCAGLVGGVMVGSQAYRYRLLGQIRSLQDAYKVYEVYYQIDRENFSDEAVQELFRLTGTEPSQEWEITRQLKKMVESGELCGGPAGTAPVETWDQVIAALVQFRGQIKN